MRIRIGAFDEDGGEIVRGERGFLIRDVGSLNGTYVNRQRVDQATLKNGDEIMIGKFRLVFFTKSAIISQ